MNNIKLYDSIKLKGSVEYAVIGITDYESKRYLLLSKFDNDNLSYDDIRYVEVKERNGKLLIKDVKDDEILFRLSKIFVNELKNI